MIDIVDIRMNYERFLISKFGDGFRIYAHGMYSGPPYNIESPTRVDFIDIEFMMIKEK